MTLVRCPTCKQPVESGAKYRPFCCERCKLVDLGRWLDGSYAIPGEPASDEELSEDLIPGNPAEDDDEGRQHRPKHEAARLRGRN